MPLIHVHGKEVVVFGCEVMNYTKGRRMIVVWYAFYQIGVLSASSNSDAEVSSKSSYPLAANKQ